MLFSITPSIVNSSKYLLPTTTRSPSQVLWNCFNAWSYWNTWWSNFSRIKLWEYILKILSGWPEIENECIYRVWFFAMVFFCEMRGRERYSMCQTLLCSTTVLPKKFYSSGASQVIFFVFFLNKILAGFTHSFDVQYRL